ncbi:unnamed protein product [Cuscuta europaea]|uniref:Pectinesterase inhibitor domain-containing protein n=1 Tax=Cuscuta europaea TaxID=41803 RepID=A0A9P1E0G9_CUSEU|nr:unnamed protein product [Cuscuta europaea]
MNNNSMVYSFLCLAAFLLSSVTALATPPFQFIRASCDSTTPYPKLCYTSLSPYAAAIGADPHILVRAALSAALKSGRSTSAAADKAAPSLPHQLRDCVPGLHRAVHRMKRSLGEIKKKKKKIRHVEALIRGAVKEYDACNDAFQELGLNGSTTISPQISLAPNLTLNALAFTAHFYAKVKCGEGRKKIEFLRASCDGMYNIYPDLCYATLLSYACANEPDRERLAKKGVSILRRSTESAARALRKIGGRDAYNMSTLVGVFLHLSNFSLQNIDTALKYWEKLHLLKGSDLSYQLLLIESLLDGVDTDYTWMSFELDNQGKERYRNKVDIALTKVIHEFDPYARIALNLFYKFESQVSS